MHDGDDDDEGDDDNNDDDDAESLMIHNESMTHDNRWCMFHDHT